MALRLIAALKDLWEQRGHLAEPLAGLEQALARGGALPADLRAEALTRLLNFLAWRGYNLTRWAGRAEELLALAEQVGDPMVRNEALYWAGLAAMHRSDFQTAQATFERILHLPQPLGDAHRVYAALAGLGWALLMRGDGVGAAPLCWRALTWAREHDLGMDLFFALNLLDLVDHRATLAQCEREVMRRRELASPEDLGQVLQVYAQALLVEGDYPRARAVLDECLAVWRGLGVQYRLGRGIAPTLLDLGQVAALQGDVTAARACYEQSLDLYRHIGDLHRVAQLHLLLGRALLAQGDLPGAAATLRRGLELYRELGQPAGVAQALLAAGALAEARGHRERTARLCAAGAAVPSRLLLSIHTVTLSPAEVVLYEREVAAARNRYSTPEFANDWAAGEEMTLEQAAEYALADGGESGDKPCAKLTATPPDDSNG
jgi:tetratricopeptide (TPR) repeat protein